MSVVHKLITDHLDIWTAADTEKKSGRGRAAGSANSVYGIKKLRELILELAVRGKLVPQDPNDEPASELLKKIAVERVEWVKSGKIKKEKTSLPIHESERTFELPPQWAWVRLSNLIEYVNGFAFSSNDFTEQGIGVVKIGDIQFGSLTPESMSRVSFNVVAGLDERLKVEPDDLVIAMSGATTGKLGFNNTNQTFYLNQRVGKIIPFIVSKKFLFWDLTTKIAANLEKSFGSAIPNLSTEQINAIVIALPPLREQNRIVAKIDELMALCDQLEQQHNNAAEAHEQLVSHLLDTLTQSQDPDDFNTNWQRIADHFDTLFTTESSIETLKQTILQLAVMGKLVRQDPNDEPASELLKRIQLEKARLIAEGKIKKDKGLPAVSEDEKPFTLPVQWEWVKFDHISENSKYALKAGPFGSALKKDMYCENGYKIYGQEQVISGDENFGDYYINEEKYQQLSSCSVKSGDILISLVGTIGRVLSLSEKCQPGIINPRLVKISLFKDLNRSYMKIIFASPLLKIEMQNKSHGGTMDILNLGLLRDLALPLPPVEEQQRIVVRVNELMTLCEQLKNILQAARSTQKKIADVLIECVLQ